MLVTAVVPVLLCDDLGEVNETDVVVVAHDPGFEVELLYFGPENSFEEAARDSDRR